MIFAIPSCPSRRMRFAQSAYESLGALCRLQVVRGFEIPLVDLSRIDEVEDVDRLRLFERRRLEVVLREDDELALRRTRSP